MSLTEPTELCVVLEAFLLAAGRPLSLEKLMALFEEHELPEPEIFSQALAILRDSCADRAMELTEVASGYRLQVAERFAPWVSRLWEERVPRYSRALLETLALIAYRQPITRGEIEEIRGVAVNSQITKTLLEREWIRVVGHRDVPGKPELFATTNTFLDYFNLKGLEDLPSLAALRDLEPEPVLAFDDALGALAVPLGSSDTAKELDFADLLAELDVLEEGIKTDFDDLAKPQLPEAET